MSGFSLARALGSNKLPFPPRASPSQSFSGCSSGYTNEERDRILGEFLPSNEMGSSSQDSTNIRRGQSFPDGQSSPQGSFFRSSAIRRSRSHVSIAAETACFSSMAYQSQPIAAALSRRTFQGVVGTMSLFLLVTAIRQYDVPEAHIDLKLRFSPLELRDGRSDVKNCSVGSFGVLLDGVLSTGATSLRKEGASLILTFSTPTMWNQWYFETPEYGRVEHDPVRFVLEAWEPDSHVSSANSIGASSGAREGGGRAIYYFPEGGGGRCSNPRGGGSDAEATEEVTESCSAASGRWRTIGSSGILSFRRTRTFFHSFFPTRHGAREIHDYSLDVVGSYVEVTRIACINACLHKKHERPAKQEKSNVQ